MLSLPLFTHLPDPQTRLQSVQEQDVAEAIALALQGPGSGPFNLAAADTFSYRDVIRAKHRRAIAVPYPLTRIALHGAWRLLGVGGEPGWLAGIRADLTLDCAKARQSFGWQPRYSSLETLKTTSQY